jgi:cyclopropane-fatty-acyl-phospholipid synthase
MENVVSHIMKRVCVTKDEFEVVNPNFYKRLLSGDSLSLIVGESYMEGEWVSNDLLSFLRKINILDNYNELFFTAIRGVPIKTLLYIIILIISICFNDIKTQIMDYLYNGQSIKLSKRVAEQHYDIPDVLYQHMLDKHRQYTCAYWKPGTTTLEEAQQNKIDLLVNKLQIPDDTEMTILDIGCGWGGLTNAISQKYPKCKVVGITISKEQIKYANDTHGNDKLKYVFCDYRDLPKQNIKYDRIISVGMFEAVGMKNFNEFFRICEKILTDNGIFVLHTITRSEIIKYITGCENTTADKWIDKYIFPGGFIPTTESVLSSAIRGKLMYHHIQNLSISYAKTLKQWHNNFVEHWDTIKKSNPSFFTEKFYKMWEFYLLSSMIMFEIKHIQLSQYVFTKRSYPGMYIFTEKNA